MSEELIKAEKALEDFLNENPHMREEQNKINELMAKVPYDKRIEVIGLLMINRLLELSKALIKLSHILPTQEGIKCQP